MRTQKRRRKARERARKLRALLSKLLIVLLIVLFIIAIILAVRLLDLGTDFPDDEVYFSWENDELWISWPELDEGSMCQLSVYDSDKKDYILIAELEDNEYILDDIKEGIPVRLRLQTVESGEDLFGNAREVKGRKKDLDIVPVSVSAPVLQKTVNVDSQEITLNWATDDTEYYEIYLMDENNNWYFHARTSEGWFNLDFAENLELPDRSQPIQVCVRACYPQNDGVFISGFSEVSTVERRELMPEYITVNWEKTANSMYRLTWDESIGDLYEVQQWNYDTAVWESMDVVNWNDPLEYEIGRIPSSRNSRYRVITYDADTDVEKRLEVAEPGIVNFWSDLSPLYCTVWPVIDLDLYADASSSDSIGWIKAGEALCVLGEENGRFQVMYQDAYGYIDSSYCLINLPEYLGDLCKYNITNSYSSIFRVHEYDIPALTDGVIQGYEDIRLENGEFLVPFLYPCSQKLRQAAENCIADGYYLVIYDAFRPNEATRYMYDNTSLILDYPLPEVYVPEEEDAEGEESEAGDSAGKETEETTEQPESVLPVDGMDPTVSGNSLAAADRYGDLIPEALANLTKMTEEELALTGLTPETVAAVSGCSAEGLIYLKSMTYETLSLIQAGVFDLSNEVYLYTQQLEAINAANAAALALDGSVPAEEAAASEDAASVSQNSGPYSMADLPVIRVDTSLMGIYIDAKGDGVEGLPLTDLLIWQSLPADQLNAFKAYLEAAVQNYYYMMTDGKYRLGSFLAQVTSAHNRGIALDLTIETAEDGEALPMQTSMHDLSWYSALPYNNENAELLAGYMKGAGFNDLSSEWWHFQDDDTRNALNLNSYLTEGLSIEGWKKNDTGWYYQLADGTYYTDTTVNIDGTTYTFDEKGYCER